MKRIIYLLWVIVAGCGPGRCAKTEALGNLGISVNSPYDDYAPALPDSSTLIFTSARTEGSGQGLREYYRNIRRTRLFYSTRLAASWEDAQPYALIPGDPDAENLATIAFAPPGASTRAVAYITACREKDGRTDCDLFAVGSATDGTARESLIDIGAEINSTSWDGQPCVSPDGSRLYFASERPGGYGGADIWFCERQATGFWSPPRNAGSEVNTAGDELSPFYDAPSGRLLFAASTPSNGLDIFVLQPGREGRYPLPAPYNTSSDEFTPFITGNILYLASNRTGGCGGYDLYGFVYR